MIVSVEEGVQPACSGSKAHKGRAINIKDDRHTVSTGRIFVRRILHILQYYGVDAAKLDANVVDDEVHGPATRMAGRKEWTNDKMLWREL